MTIYRQEGDAGGRHAQQEKGGGQLGLAAEAALYRHEHHGADRACDECERENDKGVQRAFEPFLVWEKRRRENQHRGNGVDKKVEIFRGPPDDDAKGDFPRGDMSMIVRLVIRAAVSDIWRDSATMNSC